MNTIFPEMTIVRTLVFAICDNLNGQMSYDKFIVIFKKSFKYIKIHPEYRIARAFIFTTNNFLIGKLPIKKYIDILILHLDMIMLNAKFKRQIPQTIILAKVDFF